MKLLSCYIEGFGKLKKEEIKFSDGLNSFYQENGYGKTTLSVFIKAMFYGLESYRKNGKGFAERLHYYPFDGGAYGGNIVFLHDDGRQYKIERRFGEKSETDDKLTVYVNGRETEELGDKIGEGIFGIDRESFERCNFVSSDDIVIETTDSINCVLGEVLNGTDGSESFERAFEKIEATRKKYKKSRGESDYITITQKKISELENSIRNEEETRNSLEEKYKQLNALSQQINELESRFSRAIKANEQYNYIEHYSHLTKEIDTLSEKLAEIKSRYPYGMPKEIEIDDLKDRLNREERYKILLESAQTNESDKGKLDVLSSVFKSGVPTEEDLREAESKINKSDALKTELSLFDKDKSDEKTENLLIKFENRLPDGYALLKARDSVEKYKKIQKDISYTEKTVIEKSADLPSGRFSSLIVLSILLVIAGVALCFVNIAVGIAILIFGVLVGGFSILLSEKGNAKTPLVRENPDYIRQRDMLFEIENEVRALILPYGYNSDNGIAWDFATFESDLSSYNEYKASLSLNEQRIQDKKRERDEILEELSEFFDRYGLKGAEHRKNLTNLIRLIESYRDLNHRSAGIIQHRSQIEYEREENNRAIFAFTQGYGIINPKPEKIGNDITECARLIADINNKKRQAENYRTDKRLDESQSPIKEDTTLLDRELSELRKKYSYLEREVIDEEGQIEYLDAHIEERVRLKAQLSEYKTTNRLLERTAEYLKRAEENIKERYIRPIKNEFLKYASLLEKALGQRVTMTSDLRITFEHGGIERSDRHLSEGERSLAALCFRLALIKNIYKDRRTFVVLDDPFASLDEEHMARVRSLICEIEKDMQIIYFTCHNSRAIS